MLSFSPVDRLKESMRSPKSEVLQGTLDLLVLKTLDSMAANARLRHRPVHPASLRRPREIEPRTLYPEKAALVAVVNQTMAAKYWPSRSPIGERVQVKGRWMQEVGVAKDSKHQSVRETPKPFYYVPRRQNFSIGRGLYIRTRLISETIATALDHEAHALDGNLAL
jgi:hypothetical protein